MTRQHHTPTSAMARRRRAQGAFGRFATDESGTMTFFAMMMILMIIMMSGMAVDLMRYERMRVAIQNTNDEAVLAAANLNQSEDPETVVRDYFAKAGMTNYLQSVTVTEATNLKNVTATTAATLPTYFMRVSGIDDLNTTGVSTAEQSIGNVEIAMALDNSGSMNDQAVSGSYEQCTTKRTRNGTYQSCKTVYTYTTKIAALITAANQFVDQMFTQVEPGALTMSILPYDSHLDVGNLLSYLNVSNENTVAKCIDFQAADFNTTAISPTALLQRSANFDHSGSSASVTPECNSASYRDSIVYSADETALHTMINNLQAGGNTSIDTGVKWAAATLDPSFQPVVTSMINNGALDAGFAGRPAAYSDHTFMKVLIVMSDGENTTRWQINPGYYSGNSGYFTTGTSSYWSYYDSTRTSNQYYWSYDNKWHAANYYKGAKSQPCSGSCSNYTVTDSKAAATATQWDWAAIWAKYPVDYFTDNVIATIYGSTAADTLYNKIVNTVSASTMNSYMHNICEAAKANGVLVYAIGFQTTTTGAKTLEDCASKPSFYFDAQGTEISDVFSLIASSIVHLRLTQ